MHNGRNIKTLKCAANSDYFKIYLQAGLTSTRLYIKKRCRLTKSKSDAAFKKLCFHVCRLFHFSLQAACRAQNQTKKLIFFAVSSIAGI